MPAPTAIEIQHLVKIYKGNDEPTLDGISLIVPHGEIFGLLGPNGAGKTTTLNILCGILGETSGSIRISGMDSKKNQSEIKHLIGVVPQDIALYPELSARENLQFVGSMYGLNGKRLNESINMYLARPGEICGQADKEVFRRDEAPDQPHRRYFA
jgi:ABC-2 type transport system ATP-binding protein